LLLELERKYGMNSLTLCLKHLATGERGEKRIPTLDQEEALMVPGYDQL
jgi:hypothetical protein